MEEQPPLEQSNSGRHVNIDGNVENAAIVQGDNTRIIQNITQNNYGVSDSLASILSTFEEHSKRALRRSRPRIVGLSESIPRIELGQIKDSLCAGRAVLVVGDSGTGKSGLSHVLAQDALNRRHPRLVIDAKELQAINSEEQLRRHYSLQTFSVATACSRLAEDTRANRDDETIRFLLIIDQLDNAVGTNAGNELRELALECSANPLIDVVVLSRRREPQEERFLQPLYDDEAFVEVRSEGLLDAMPYLEEMGVLFVESAIPLILNWLSDSTLASSLIFDVTQLTFDLAAMRHSAAFDLLQVLTTPLPSPHATKLESLGNYVSNAEAISIAERHYLTESKEGKEFLENVRHTDFERLVSLWQHQLLAALHIENQTKGYDEEVIGDSTWWRPAIEDNGQNLGHYYKDLLLECLRDTIVAEGKENPLRISPIIENLLRHERQILRRLGLHLLRVFAAEFTGQVQEFLLDATKYEDATIHHEFFMLLQDGFANLDSSVQRQVITLICNGPSEEYLQRRIEFAEASRGGDREEHRQLYTETWRRDLLWMLREQLPEEDKAYLKELTTRWNSPDHPSFTSYFSGSYFVASVSPMPVEALKDYSPEQLKDYLATWQPNPDQQHGPEQVNWQGLAGEVGELIRSDVAKYADVLLPIAKLNSQLASSLLNIALAVERRASNLRIEKVAEQPSDDKPEERSTFESSGAESPLDQDTSQLSQHELWAIRISFMEDFLADDRLRTDMTPDFHGGWPPVRRSMVDILKAGFQEDVAIRLPDEFLPRVRDVLLILANDPDPDQIADRPPPGWSGHNNPLHVAINHVRSDALSALIDYARHKAIEECERNGSLEKGVGPSRLEPAVAAMLSSHIDRDHDNSWAVHSIYGRHISTLYWLDQKWVESHLNDFFPPDDDDEARWYFAAAWDAYVVFNWQLYPSLFQKLRPHYVRAIEAMAQGFVTSTHLEHTKHFASHLFYEFFMYPYDLRSEPGPNNLLRLFFEKASPDARGQAAWVLWRYVSRHDDQDVEENGEEAGELAKWTPSRRWAKAKEFWQWRVDTASQAGNSGDFDPEMEWLMLLLNAAPEEETIASLLPLLSATLPHLSRDRYRSHAWDDMEKFLVREVKRDALNAIRFYRMMHVERERPMWWHGDDDARTILETAAADPNAREIALELIDYLARKGNHSYDDIFKKWTNLHS
jgi:hypothetical protein